MSWRKEKNTVLIKRGQGQIVTTLLRGFIQQLIVTPDSSDTIWSMTILDKDNDCIYMVKDHQGQLNDRQGLSVGKDQMEKLTINFDELTKNENIKVILNIKENQ